jgi:hypothetical protein
MRKLFLLVATLLFTHAGWATVYHVSRGVKYHVGDTAKHRKGGDFEDAMRRVGPTWQQPILLTTDDRILVSIRNLFGLDQRASGKTLIFLDDLPLGEIDGSNLSAFQGTVTPQLVAGRVYNLRIVSLGRKKDEDFAFEDVVVKTLDDAELRLAGPPEIEEIVPLTTSPCEKLQEQKGVGFGLDSNPNFTLAANPDEFSESEALAQVSPGQEVSLYFRVQDVLKVDKVSQPIEILAVQQDKPSGWVLSYVLGEDRLDHGNLLRHGRYTRDIFDVPNYQPRQWNLIRMTYCRDNTVRLFLNNKQISQAFTDFNGDFTFKLRAQGLQLSTYKAISYAGAPGVQPPR